MKEYVFTTTGPNITAQVAPTMEALGSRYIRKSSTQFVVEK